MKTPAQLAGEIEARAFVLQASGLSPAQARKRAGREIAAREKRRAVAAGTGAGPSPVPPASAGSLSADHIQLRETFSRWISHVWSRAEETMERVRRKNKRPAPTIAEPSMGAAPVVVYEPSQPLSADPKLQQHFQPPLIISYFSSAKIIPNSEFPVRYTDLASENFRRSILQNEQIAKERAARSLQLQNRNRGRYVG
jgi:hypothetical protein